jgi:hypothetical protein
MNKGPLNLIALLAAIGIVGAIVAGCKSGGQYRPGEIYSVQDEKGYKVAKVLAVDSTVVHIRLYKNVFPERPRSVDVTTLTLGTIHDADGFGIGHLPVTARTFSSWLPVLITRTTVAQEELEGYEEWKKSKGGAFGDED